MIAESGDAIKAALGVVWDICTANTLLKMLTGAGVVGLGFTFFKRAKRLVR